MSSIAVLRRPLLFLSLALVVVVPQARAQDTETTWPREINTPEGKIVIYQPQLEAFDEVTLKARSAVSVTLPDAKEPVFGATWFTGRVSIDRDANRVTLLDVAVTNARFPNASEAHLDRFKRIVEAEIPKWELELSYDQLLASMAAVEDQKEKSAKLDNSPPEIIFSRKPTVLVLIDGEPVLRDVENTKLKYVLNTPFLHRAGHGDRVVLPEGCGGVVLGARDHGPVDGHAQRSTRGGHLTRRPAGAGAADGRGGR